MGTDESSVMVYRRRLAELARDGRELRAGLAVDGSRAAPLAAFRSWQQACAATVHELSGGRKAHWLARAFSDAFLVRSTSGAVLDQAPVGAIVDRILGVLQQAADSVGQIPDGATASTAAPRPRRFEFVHNPGLRPVLERAFDHAREAFEDGQFRESLATACSVLEAVITDALEHTGSNSPEWSFDARIAAAERAGLIRGGCARLPGVARRYRELAGATGLLDADVTARDARVTMQVLQVVIRDLDPGR